MDLKRAVVDVRCTALVQEEAVMIYIFGAAVNMCKQRDVLVGGILFRLDPKEIGRDNVEVSGIELDL